MRAHAGGCGDVVDADDEDALPVVGDVGHLQTERAVRRRPHRS